VRRMIVVASESWRRVGASRATFGFALLFSLLAIGLSYFGLAGQRSAGFQGFARVTASLLNLVVYLVPLLALIMGTAEVTARRQQLAVILAQPVRRHEVLLGNFLGVAAALASALAIGLGGAGLLIALQTDTASLSAYLVIVACSIGLLLSFLALAYLIGVLLLDRLRAMSAAIIIWFAAVVGYDLVLIGITAVLRGIPLKVILLPAILFNPVDISRVLVTLASGRGALFGPAGAVLVGIFGAPLGAGMAVAALLLEILLPLTLAVWIFRRRDL